MTTLLDEWHRDHANFTRLLALLQDALVESREKHVGDYELMSDIMYYMTHYPDVSHHPKEDLIFDRATEADPGLRPTVRILMEQHAVLRHAGHALSEELDAVVRGAMVPRERVEEPARTYIDFFRAHMALEEETLFPVLHQLVLDADWAQAELLIPRKNDPVFSDERVTQRYENLRRRLLRDPS